MEQLLLILKGAFLLLLYLFVWRMITTAARDLRTPQESFVMAPAQAAALLQTDPPAQAGELVVERSSSLASGRSFAAAPVPLTIGRAADNLLVLAADEFVSAHHARVESARDGSWLIDLDSTNGTYVNGERVQGRRQLEPGDLVRIGETELRVQR